MLLTLLIILPFLLNARLAAQDSGQICVRAFDDRDGDGAYDAGESAIQSGISASLLNAAGITIDSALLEDSPFAAEGLFCFDELPAGEYRVALNSAEYRATGSASFAASVTPGEAPPRIDFGARPLPIDAARRAGAGLALDAEAIAALLRSALGAGLAFALICLVGATTILFIFRRRRRPRAAQGRTGAMPRFDPARQPAPGAGSPMSLTGDETEAPRAGQTMTDAGVR